MYNPKPAPGLNESDFVNGSKILGTNLALIPIPVSMMRIVTFFRSSLIESTTRMLPCFVNLIELDRPLMRMLMSTTNVAR
jgi:hypothetical protein